VIIYTKYTEFAYDIMPRFALLLSILLDILVSTVSILYMNVCMNMYVYYLMFCLWQWRLNKLLIIIIRF